MQLNFSLKTLRNDQETGSTEKAKLDSSTLYWHLVWDTSIKEKTRDENNEEQRKKEKNYSSEWVKWQRPVQVE